MSWYFSSVHNALRGLIDARVHVQTVVGVCEALRGVSSSGLTSDTPALKPGKALAFLGESAVRVETSLCFVVVGIRRGEAPDVPPISHAQQHTRLAFGVLSS